MPLDTRLITVAELADYLSVSVPTVYRLCRRRENPLPFLEVARTIRFRFSEVERWLESTAAQKERKEERRTKRLRRRRKKRTRRAS